MSLSLQELQKVELDILQEVHDLLQRNHLTYFLAYGTLLGAARHKGFIPWDDDVDIFMPREDYEAFLKAAPGELPEYLCLKDASTANPYIYTFAKVEDKRTLLVEGTYSYLNIEGGVYIDIFPLDGIPGKGLLKKIQYRRTRLSMQLLAMYYSDVNKKRSFWKQRIVLAVKKHYTQDSLFRKVNQNMTRYSYRDSPYVVSYNGDCGLRDVLPKQVYGAPQPVLFEGRTFFAPQDTERVLTEGYGNYRELPPEDQRGGHSHLVVEMREKN